MKNRQQSIHLWLFRSFTGVAALASLISPASISLAQSSVEKSETSQQAREPESELERARALVTKPTEPKPQAPETGRVWGGDSTTSSLELGYRFVDPDGSHNRYLS